MGSPLGVGGVFRTPPTPNGEVSHGDYYQTLLKPMADIMNADTYNDDQRFDKHFTNSEYVKGENKQGYVPTENEISKQKGGKDNDWATAEKYLHSNMPVEQKIIDQNKGGLLVEFGNLQGFLPNSQIPDFKKISQSNHAFELKRRMIGTNMRLLIIEADKPRDRLIFSAKFERDEQSNNQFSG